MQFDNEVNNEFLDILQGKIGNKPVFAFVRQKFLLLNENKQQDYSKNLKVDSDNVPENTGSDNVVMNDFGKEYKYYKNEIIHSNPKILNKSESGQIADNEKSEKLDDEIINNDFVEIGSEKNYTNSSSLETNFCIEKVTKNNIVTKNNDDVENTGVNNLKSNIILIKTEDEVNVKTNFKIYSNNQTNAISEGALLKSSKTQRNQIHGIEINEELRFEIGQKYIKNNDSGCDMQKNAYKKHVDNKGTNNLRKNMQNRRSRNMTITEAAFIKDFQNQDSQVPKIKIDEQVTSKTEQKHIQNNNSGCGIRKFVYKKHVDNKGTDNSPTNIPSRLSKNLTITKEDYIKGLKNLQNLKIDLIKENICRYGLVYMQIWSQMPNNSTNERLNRCNCITEENYKNYLNHFNIIKKNNVKNSSNSSITERNYITHNNSDFIKDQINSKNNDKKSEFQNINNKKQNK